MRTIGSEIEEKVDELLVCLETDARHIRENLAHLNDLRSLVIRRDDAALSKLLERIQAKSGKYEQHESKRQSIRRDLANMLGCEVWQVTLTALSSHLSETRREQTTEIQKELRSLTAELKTEHTSTAKLVSECARFNGLLLRSIFDMGRTGAVYYNSSGAAKRQVGTALMNLQL